MMKQATTAFALDNGTVYEGQVLPDGHPAVVRYPENFSDVLTDVTDDDGAIDATAAPGGVTVDGTAKTAPVVEPPASTETTSTTQTAPPSAAGTPGPVHIDEQDEQDAGKHAAPFPEATLYEHLGTGAFVAEEWPVAEQTTADGKPLYHFAGDHVPGDVNGASADWQVYTPPASAS